MSAVLPNRLVARFSARVTRSRPMVRAMVALVDRCFLGHAGGMLYVTRGAAFGPVEFPLRNTDATPPIFTSAEIRIVDGERVIHTSTVASGEIVATPSVYLVVWSLLGAATADLEVGVFEVVMTTRAADGTVRRVEWDGLGGESLWLTVRDLPGGIA